MCLFLSSWVCTYFATLEFLSLSVITSFAPTFLSYPLIDPSGTIDNLKTAIEAISGVSCTEQQLIYNGRPVPNSGSIASLQLSEHDILILNRTDPTRKIHLSDIPNSTSPEEWIRLVTEHANLKTQLSNADPELFAFVDRGDVPGIRSLLMKRIMSGHKTAYEKKLQRDRIWADPDNEENQRLIAEQVRLENVQANMVCR